MRCFHIEMARAPGQQRAYAYRGNRLGGRQCVNPGFSCVAWWRY